MATINELRTAFINAMPSYIKDAMMTDLNDEADEKLKYYNITTIEMAEYAGADSDLWGEDGMTFKPTHYHSIFSKRKEKDIPIEVASQWRRLIQEWAQNEKNAHNYR